MSFACADVDLRPAYLDNGKLRRHKKAIEEDQKKGKENIDNHNSRMPAIKRKFRKSMNYNLS